jgi:2-keto-3-deoxy-L-arabinonate dehydratase
MAKPLSGILPILAAPFTAEGALDEDSFQTLVRRLVGSGVGGLTLFGLVTEFYKLTDAERARLQALLLAETSRAPSVAGIISITDHSWEVAVARAQAAEAQGADALMVLPPYFLAPSQEAVWQHLVRVIGSVRLPVIVQYAPVQTGLRLAPEFFVRLRDALPNAALVKVEAQPTAPYLGALLAGSGGRLGALAGYAGVQMPAVLARGAAGIQPSSSFVEVYVELWRRWATDRAAFEALHTQLLPYIVEWMQSLEFVIRADKVILHRRGLIASDYCRAPTYTLDAPELARIEQFLERFEAWLA